MKITKRTLFALQVIGLSIINAFEMNGNNEFIFGIPISEEKLTFENWLDIEIKEKRIKFDLGVELHLPSPVGALDANGVYLNRRTFIYQGESVVVKIGDFEEEFSSGLTLKVHELRNLNWDNRMDGISLYSLNEWGELKGFVGHQMAHISEVVGIVHGAMFQWNGWPYLVPGFSYVQFNDTLFQKAEEEEWGSLWIEHSSSNLDFFMEFAGNENLDSFEKLQQGFVRVGEARSAFYSNVNLFLWELSIAIEYKNYQNFNINKGVQINAPPLGVKEHEFSFPLRQLLVQNARDEVGWHGNAGWELLDGHDITFDVSIYEKHQGSLVYEDIHMLYDWNRGAFTMSQIILGKQKDQGLENYNFGFLNSSKFFQLAPLELRYEYQQSIIPLTERMYYSQLLGVGVNFYFGLSLAFSGEVSTDQLSKDSHWLSFELEYAINDQNDLSVFWGSRKAGKFCTSGICLYKPDFDGVEVLVQSKF